MSGTSKQLVFPPRPDRELTEEDVELLQTVDPYGILNAGKIPDFDPETEKLVVTYTFSLNPRSYGVYRRAD
jgi:hypothetical protein